MAITETVGAEATSDEARVLALCAHLLAEASAQALLLALQSS